MGIALAVVVVALGACPAPADAHGPIAPVASSYFAKVLRIPTRMEAKVVDGDLRMWLRVPAAETVVVLDYRGAPYLRFSSAGVAVNHNSAMYYLNQTPFALTPPANLTAQTPSSWHPVSDGHAYEWHDGRLHALASVALTPGVSFVGHWKVPLRVDGRLAAIGGGLWHADNPSAVWFWPIVVVLACVLAARRVRRRRLDVAVARVLAVVGLIAVAIAGLGLELHGRPGVSVFHLVELGFIVAFVAWGLSRALLHGPRYFAVFLIAVGAIWAGGVLIPTLLHGFVLIALPAFLARAVTVTCLATGAGLLLLVFRLHDLEDRDSGPSGLHEEFDGEDLDVESLA
ncbi:MAG: hypothetical protein JO304_12505 [Solirubrobacterales bacterium]|nr:hypothetical protein [Solirubrobacterales bacterium]